MNPEDISKTFTELQVKKAIQILEEKEKDSK